MAKPLDEDLESAILIAQLQLEDALEVSRGRKGKARASAPRTDEELAFEIQAEELGSWKQIHQDYTLAKSLSDALDQDGALLEAYRVMEEAAREDRRVAELVSRGLPAPTPTEAQARLERRDFSLERASRNATPKPRQRVPVGIAEPQLGEEEPLDSIWRFDDLSESLPKASPSVDRYNRVDCVGCDTKLRPAEAILTLCNHNWCTSCLRSLIEVYLRDETLHPLRCCKNPFDPPLITSRLSSYRRLLDQYNAKRAEILGSSEAQPIGLPDILCARCGSSTCSTCKNHTHEGDQCKQNEAVDQLRALARESGWQTCPGCNTIVDLHHGCNHMTCTCRSEFCFVCGVPWKDCECPQWDEERLLDTARMRAQNDLGEAVREAEPVRYEEVVVRMAENLRGNHGCQNHWWRSTGAGRCEECGDYMRLFLKMCRNCNLVPLWHEARWTRTATSQATIMEEVPYIATEILELVIDELGAEAQSFESPSTSEAFKTLLNVSLTARRARPRCEQYLFTTLVFDSPERKIRPNANAAWRHLKTTVDILETKPHLAAHIHHLSISFHRSFPSHMTTSIISPTYNRLEDALDYAEEALPMVLEKLKNVTWFSLDAYGCKAGGFNWWNLPQSVRSSVMTFFGRLKEDGNVLQELSLANFTKLPANIFNILPSSVKALRLGPATFEPPDLQKHWKLMLRELDCETPYNFIKKAAPRTPSQERRPSHLRVLRCWVPPTAANGVNKFGNALKKLSSTLHSLDISVYGTERHATVFSSYLRLVESFSQLCSLSVAVEVEGCVIPTPRTTSSCPSRIPKLIRYIVDSAPKLQSVSIHAVWSFNPQPDMANPPIFIAPQKGWEELDESLSQATSLTSVQVRATPHATSHSQSSWP
ncbi:hypothetical protein NMY22_g1599 [Coprinellus aureogranulatus]|nr:hypothetical protein NMY22_g1599 [Coprinellus aureogranulatus]